MQAGADASRSTLAYKVARRLICFSGSEFEANSAVQVAKEKLHELLAGEHIPESQHRQLFYALESLEGCDIDRCVRLEGLVQEVATSLRARPDVFSEEELERLLHLL
jgi:hypothetical protein